MTSSSMNQYHHQVVHEDQMTLVSQFYPHDIYKTQIVADDQGGGETKKIRRRRKKAAKGEGVVGARKRKLSAEQVTMLEKNFGNEHKLESERKDKIAGELGLEPRQVAVWFQNRRARWKTKKLEQEFSRLKMSHDKVVLHNCHLESEVLKLKEELSEAEKRIHVTSERNLDVASSNSPLSALSMDAMDRPFIGEFGVEGFDDVFCAPENCYAYNMEWASYYYM